MQLEKYELMEWLININDKSIISKIKKLKESLAQEPNGNIGLPQELELLLDQSMNDSKSGKTKAHVDVMQEIKAKYNL
ncbi:hypothetical protein [Bizionia arctica]|nr:hypothetical protein [Bizionia arctica]